MELSESNEYARRKLRVAAAMQRKARRLLRNGEIERGLIAGRSSIRPMKQAIAKIVAGRSLGQRPTLDPETREGYRGSSQIWVRRPFQGGRETGKP